MLNGAMRYAAERTGQDQRYTKHPATWLNGQCWKDESNAAAPRATTGFASVLAGLAAIPDDDGEQR
jgi:hypothetical protein